VVPIPRQDEAILHKSLTLSHSSLCNNKQMLITAWQEELGGPIFFTSRLCVSASLEPIEDSVLPTTIADTHQDHPTSIDWRILSGFVALGLYLYFAF